MLALYIVFVVLVAAAVFAAQRQLARENALRESISNIEISAVDFSKTPDGVFYGQCVTAMTSAEVKVTVKGERATDIELLSFETGRGAEAEVLVLVAEAEQSLELDAITGATESSRVILKAIERALLSARRSCPYGEQAAL
ncbi:MAG: FMN-binding protein [Oscillospiraceae bacterium]|nr:FMN-binding protein [Oscillospiraceae bacterium]